MSWILMPKEGATMHWQRLLAIILLPPLLALTAYALMDVGVVAKQ